MSSEEEELKRFEEPARGLSRTRSSQDLKDNRDNSDSEKLLKQNIDFNQDLQE